MPQLVIFDCDGVLVDSERISHEVLQQMLAEHGHRISFEQAVATFMGSSMQRALELVEAMVQVPPEQFLPAFRTRSFEAFKTSLQPVAGVTELLDSLAVPFCVASNGPREKMSLTLTRTGLMHHFAGRMFSADDVAHPKPAPDLFLLAAARLGVAPAACVVVEDSPTGVRAARAAGMTVFGYAALMSAQQLLDAGAHRTFDRMQDLPALLGQAGAYHRFTGSDASRSFTPQPGAPMSHPPPLKHEHTALVESHFVDVDLQRTAFEDVNLRGSVFRNVAFTDARFENVCFGNVDIGDANIEGMKINGILVTDLLRVYAQAHPK